MIPLLHVSYGSVHWPTVYRVYGCGIFISESASTQTRKAAKKSFLRRASRLICNLNSLKIYLLKIVIRLSINETLARQTVHLIAWPVQKWNAEVHVDEGLLTPLGLSM